MCYSSENRERKNSLCVKVKFTTNVHSPKEVFRCGHYNTGYAFSPNGRTIAGFAVEYGISGATVSNWVRSYRSTVKCYVQLCLHPLIQ